MTCRNEEISWSREHCMLTEVTIKVPKEIGDTIADESCGVFLSRRDMTILAH